VRNLIEYGLGHYQSDPSILSLVFQGLANLARVEGWSAEKQAELASKLLDMIPDIEKDSQHAALNAILRLVSVPDKSFDVYDLLIKVHATLGGRSMNLEPEFKALASAIYGFLGTVERHVSFSIVTKWNHSDFSACVESGRFFPADAAKKQDARAASYREKSRYSRKVELDSQVAEIRDRYGPKSSTHFNWLVMKNLFAALEPEEKIDKERAAVFEAILSCGVLQPAALPVLLPGLPRLLLAEIETALNHAPQDHKEPISDQVTRATIETSTVPAPAGIMFLSATLWLGSEWLEEYWSRTALVFGEANKTVEGASSVLQGLNMILDAIEE
jgi:hypothetical protein